MVQFHPSPSLFSIGVRLQRLLRSLQSILEQGREYKVYNFYLCLDCVFVVAAKCSQGQKKLKIA